MLIVSILILSIASCNSWIVNGEDTLDVIHYGARGDGDSDDTQVRVYTILHSNFFLTFYN